MMKAVICIPDDVLARAEDSACAQGISLSELITQAVRLYLGQATSVESDKLAAINELVEQLGPDAFTLAEESRTQLNRLQGESR